MCLLIAVSSIDTVVSIIALYFHHHLPTNVPRFLKTVLFKYLARLVCMSNEVPKVDKDDDIIEIKDDNLSVSSVAKYPLKEETVGNDHSGQNGFSQQLEQVIQHLRAINRHIKEKEEEANAMDEWKAVARVIDRFMFWVIFFIIIISTLFCFLLRGGEPVTEE